MNLYGKQCLAVSDYMIKMPYCFYFNAELISSLQLEDPYQLVRDGKWTMDQLLEMSAAATFDLNGDGNFDANDRYGLISQADSELNSFIYACGLSLTERNKDGGLDLVINNERTVVTAVLTELNGSTCEYRAVLNQHITAVTEV